MEPLTTYEHLGARLRALRQAKGYTLEETARLAGLSRSFLSMLENGKTRIAAARLERLANVFGLSASDLLPPTDGQTQVQVVRSGRAPTIGGLGEGVKGSLLSSDFRRLLQPVIMTLVPGASHVNTVGHAGEELVFVLSGQLKLTVGGYDVTLRQGDAAHYPSALPHGYTNVGDGDVELLTISTPPKVV